MKYCGDIALAVDGLDIDLEISWPSKKAFFSRCRNQQMIKVGIKLKAEMHQTNHIPFCIVSQQTTKERKQERRGTIIHLTCVCATESNGKPLDYL